jgi:hypothetical protein
MSDINITLRDEFVAAPGNTGADLGDETVLLDVVGGQYFGLNPIGAQVWAMVQEPRTVEAIRDRLLNEYEGVDPELCTADLLSFLEELLAAGLVNRAPASPR